MSVFAVGVERGVHYYAMQFIDGQPLDRAFAELQETAEHVSRRGDGTSLVRQQSDDASDTDDADDCPRTVEFRTSRSGATAGSPAVENSHCPHCCTSQQWRHPSRRFFSFVSDREIARQHEYFRTVVRLGIQAAEALHAAHEQGMVHRDIKPSNLLLDGDGKLWVTDFGLARCQTDAPLTRTGDIVGTLRYMSPEQATGQSALVDHRTDVYSLGVTLYELLALQPAFPGDDGPALLRRIEQQEPRPLRQLQPKAPGRFGDRGPEGHGQAARGPLHHGPGLCRRSAARSGRQADGRQAADRRRAAGEVGAPPQARGGGRGGRCRAGAGGHGGQHVVHRPGEIQGRSENPRRTDYLAPKSTSAKPRRW